ncbi:carbohydrate ABC transporter permease [Paenibacillus glycanilyticus]|uniref:ABC transporter permease n=1 Tax=Paenibacillus glycanilyticus TaxID=126569 RepID=A0ABQ6GNX1_9BACL|nr:carbohydrate ABC transporter permease [Paenibacillus glycanilyticus]GLX71163.1 ABC transporter permease [Paenibacillus glycanilyticus]
MRLSLPERAFSVFNGLLLMLLAVGTLYPFYHVLMASFSDSKQLIAHSGVLLRPLGFQLDAYQAVLDNPNILNGYRNTIVIVVTGTLINLIMTTVAAYALSRTFMLKNTLLMMIVFTMFFSGGLIPNFLLVNNFLHMGGTYWALILPSAINSWNLIVMITSMRSIPESLIESARMDGAGEFRVLLRIVVPLSMPVISVMLLYYGVAHWNSWFQALLYLRDRETFPLQLILREILIFKNTESMSIGAGVGDQEAIGESIRYATIMVATLPILLVYPFLQKYFVKGVMVGAIKE